MPKGLLLLAVVVAGMGCVRAQTAEAKARLHWQQHCDLDIPPYGLSPDGRWIAVGCQRSIRMWDLASGLEVRRFPAEGKLEEYIGAVAFTRDGQGILEGGQDGSLRLWSVESGRVLREYAKSKDEVRAVSISADGTMLAAAAGHFAIVDAVESGKEITRIDYHDRYVTSVDFSRDGRELLTGDSDGSFCIGETGTSKSREFVVDKTASVRASFSEGGSRVFTITSNNIAQIWDAATGREIHRWDAFREAALSPNGSLALLGSKEHRYLLIDTETGRTLKTFETNYKQDWEMNWAAFLPDGQRILIGNEVGTYHVLDVQSGEETGGHAEPDLGTDPIFQFVSEDGQTVGGGNPKTGFFLWDVTGERPDRNMRIEGPEEESKAKEPQSGQASTSKNSLVAAMSKSWNFIDGNIYEIPGDIPSGESAFSRDRSMLAIYGSKDKIVHLLDTKTGKEIRQVGGKQEKVSALRFTPDGRLLITGGEDRIARLWDVSTGRMVREIDTGAIIDLVAISSDGQLLATTGKDKPATLWDEMTGASAHGWVSLWDISTGKQVSRIAAQNDAIRSLALSPQGKTLLTGGDDMAAEVWDLQSGKEIRRFTGHIQAVSSVAFTPDGRTAVTCGGEIKLWDVETGQEKATMLLANDGGWTVVDGDGRYDASDPDNAPDLHFVAGFDVIELRQLKQRFYTPELLSRILHGEKFDPIDNLTHVKPAPGVALIAPEKGSALATFRLTNRGGGLGRLVVRVNGRELPTATRGAEYPADAASAAVKIDLSRATLSPTGQNVIEVSAFNSDNSIQSRGVTVSWNAELPQDNHPPRIYIIVAGVGEFASHAMNLRYAANDAKDMGEALRLAATGLYNDSSRLKETVLASGTALEPTRQNIEDAFADVAKEARAQDLLIVYLAGHGMASRLKRDEYYFFTKEARDMEVDSDAELRAATTISSTELRQWLYRKNMPLKQVIVLDTCAAGAALTQMASLNESRSLSPDQARAIELLKDATGSWILMGSAADAVSYEANRYAHGLVTYSLLEGMKGAALDGDRVEVSRLFGYAQREVEELAQGIGGVQRPILSAPKGQTFPIGLLTVADRSQIHLTASRLLLLPPRVLGDEDLDSLNIEPALRAALRAACQPKPRGGAGAETTLDYLDSVAGEVPEALTPLVRYSVTEKRVTVRVRLLQNGRPVSDQSLTLEGLDVSTVANSIANEIVRQAEKAR